ncbi:MAG: hypothetical protein P1U56_03000 [Saprospiraceae bacterium]|nr:hypothetical protein [Saprospiraceae bacterium]
MKPTPTSAVEFHIQYPFCDIRKLLETKEEIIRPRPDWEIPKAGQHFIQYFGHVKRRARGGHPFFPKEDHFVEGKGGLKFLKLEKVDIDKISKLTSMYRRLGSDGTAGARYEYGFEFEDFGRFEEINDNFYVKFNEFIEEVFTKVKLSVRTENKDKATSIANAGKYITQLYQSATELESNEKLPRKVISRGEIGIFIRVNKEVLKLPKEIEEKSIKIDEHISLALYRHQFLNKPTGVFILTTDSKANPKLLRSVRISVMRMFFEHQNLSQLLSLCRNPRIKFNFDELDKYLLNKLKYVERRVKKNEKVAELRQHIFSYFDLISPHETEALVKTMGQIRAQNSNKLVAYIGEASMTFKGRFTNEETERFKKWIGKNKVEEVIQMLEKSATSTEIERRLILLKSRYNEYKANKRDGLITSSKATVEFNQIKLSLLGFFGNKD